LDAIAPGLAKEGYVVSKFDCEHGAGDAGPTNEWWCVCGMNLVEIACPVCGSRHWNTQSLKAHVEESHVSVGEDITLFRQQILALIGMEAIQVLGRDSWSDVACQLRQDT
jgi:hypothetical protein